MNAFASMKPGDGVLVGMFDKYIEGKKRIRESTRMNYTYLYDRFVRDGLGEKKLAKMERIEKPNNKKKTIHGKFETNLDPYNVKMHIAEDLLTYSLTCNAIFLFFDYASFSMTGILSYTLCHELQLPSFVMRYIAAYGLLGYGLYRGCERLRF